ncbi:MAG: sarcosine oxidase subunit gamma [Methylophilaceae bacterium]
MLNLENLKPEMKSPLHHFALSENEQAINDANGVWVNELALLGYISLRGSSQNKKFTAAFKKAAGIALPTQPCSLAKADWGSILWLSPDEWLIVCHRNHHVKLLGDLQSAMAGIHSQVVDNAGGYTAVVVQGKHAADTLHHCTVYDLTTLTSGRVVGTTFGKTNIIMSKLELGYVLILRRSFADYIWQYFARSASPYGLGIAKPNGNAFP